VRFFPSVVARNDTIVIEIGRDSLEGMAEQVTFGNSEHRPRLVRFHRKPHAFDFRPAAAIAFRCALDRHAATAEHSAANVQAIQREVFHSSEGALRKSY
jgi:hypothetical protein